MSHLHQYFRIDVCLLPGATQRASLLKSPLDSRLNLSWAHPVLGFCCNLERFDFPASLQNSQLLSFQRRFVPHTTMLADTPHLFVSEGDVLDCIMCAFLSILTMAAFQLSALASEGFLGFTSLFSQTQTHTSGQPDPSYLSACECQTHTHTHTHALDPPALPTFLLSLSPLFFSLFSACVSFSLFLCLSTLVHLIVSGLFIFLHFLCLAPRALSRPLFQAPPVFLHMSLSLRDVTFSTDIGAVASNLWQRDERTNTHTYRHMQI